MTLLANLMYNISTAFVDGKCKLKKNERIVESKGRSALSKHSHLVSYINVITQ